MTERSTGDYVNYDGKLVVIMGIHADYYTVLADNKFFSVQKRLIKDMTRTQSRAVDIALHYQVMGLSDEFVEWLGNLES